MFKIGFLAASRLKGGGAAPAPAYRYFRIYIFENAGDTFYTALGEFILASTIGGATFATGGTATALTYNGSNDPAKAFDGNVATYWAAQFNSKFPQWVQYDLGPGVTNSLGSYRIGVNNETDRMPKTWVIEGSNNGTDWFTLDYQTGRDDAYWISIGLNNYASFTPLPVGDVRMYNESAFVLRSPAVTNIRTKRTEVMVVRTL